MDLLPQELKSLIFLQTDFETCVKNKLPYEAKKLYNSEIHTWKCMAANGHLDIIKWLHENRKEGCVVEAMNGATINGHFEVVKWIYENRKEECTMDYAAKYGYFEVLKWLHFNTADGCTEAAMDWAARNGCLETVKWLYENRTEGYSANAMIWAEEKRHLDIVRWLSLNDEQRKLYSELTKFVEDKNRQIFLLDSAGGTGKTFTITRFIHNSHEEFVVLAPTHKACQVLRQNGVNAITLHLFLNYKIEYDQYGKEVATFNPPKDFKGILVIDESSMITRKLYSILLKLKCKLILLGDSCQLPPVNEGTSCVFNNTVNFKLLENQRIKKNNAGIVISNYRKRIGKCPGIENYHQKSFLKKSINLFRLKKDVVVLAYTNKKVNCYNDFIRKKLFGEDVDRFCKGETLRIDDYYNCKDSKEVMLLHEGLDYGFEAISEISPPKNRYYSSTFIETVHMNIVNKTLSFEGVEDTIKFYEIINEKGDYFNAPYDEYNKKKLLDYIDRYKKYIQKKMKPMNISQRKELWKLYNHTKRYYMPKFGYIYSSTIHKSQGSGWEHVFVDELNVNVACDKKDIDLKWKLLYTAVSRSKSELYILK